MPPKKRKTSDEPDSDEPKAAPPVTGEKRKRGRPRKYPESTTPKPPPGPKRGRGRPRKDASEKGTPLANPVQALGGIAMRKHEPGGKADSYMKTMTVTPAKTNTTPREGKRPVGRPRKYPLQNGSDAHTSKSQSVEDKEEEEEEEEEEEDDDSGRSYWLMKAEPESRLEKGADVKFSIDDLRAAKAPEPWNGIRNAVARKHLRKMKKGDHAFFYHSNCKVPGIVGIMEIVQEHSPDETALDPADPYYDEKATEDDPKWDVVHVEFRHKFPSMVSLNDLKAQSGPGRPLEDMQTLKQSRLSVSPVTPAQWKFILALAKEKAGGSEEESSKDEESEAESSE